MKKFLIFMSFLIFLEPLAIAMENEEDDTNSWIRCRRSPIKIIQEIDTRTCCGPLCFISSICCIGSLCCCKSSLSFALFTAATMGSYCGSILCNSD